MRNLQYIRSVSLYSWGLSRGERNEVFDLRTFWFRDNSYLCTLHHVSGRLRVGERINSIKLCCCCCYVHLKEFFRNSFFNRKFDDTPKKLFSALRPELFLVKFCSQSWEGSEHQISELQKLQTIILSKSHFQSTLWFVEKKQTIAEITTVIFRNW